jgi:hypothetical protein
MEEKFNLYCHAVQQHSYSSFATGTYTLRARGYFKHFEITNELPEDMPNSGKYSQAELAELKYLPKSIKKELSKL